MSRSYKRTPIIRYEKQDYHCLNRLVRHDKLEDIPNGGSYRKMFVKDSEWDCRWTWQDAIESYYNREYLRERFTTLEDYYNYWQRCVVRK
jgi:hypothetical protein